MTKDNKVFFIMGRAKTGKTYELLRRIAENERRGERSLFIVPSSYTFECEKRLAEFCGGGFMHTSVCGFFRMGQKVLSEKNLENAFITEQGRIMVIRRSLELADLGIFRNAAKQPGFAIMCDELISNFVTCELSSGDIFQTIENAEMNNVLREKMADLAKIYSITEEYLNETGQQLHAASEMICDMIPKSDFCNAHVYIDGIENPGEQTYRMFEAMLSAAKSMTVALRCDNESDLRVFERENRIYSRLRAIVKEKGYETEIIRMERKERYESKALEHMERELWNFPMRKFAGDSQCIELVAASDIRTETEMVAAAVLKKAKEGVRYRNMAVVAANPKKYNVLLKSTFERLGIPIFADSRLKLSATNAALLTSGALRCVASGYQASDVIAVMKTGLSGIENSDAEKLENYMNAYGISGSDFLKPFSIGEVSEMLEDTRKRLIMPLRNMQEKMSHATVAQKVDALMDYLKELDVEEKLKQITQSFADEGKHSLARQYAQVWEMICEVLRQLKDVMGDTRLSTEKIADIVEEGLSADIIEIIPAGVDLLSYSGISSVMPNNIEYLFVLGAVADDFPAVRRDDNVIDDSELQTLKDSGLNVWLSVQSKREQDEANIYTLLTTPTKGLYISYPITSDGEYTQPASILNRICAMLDKKCASDADDTCNYRLYTEDRIAARLRDMAEKKQIDDDDARYIAWFIKSDKHKDEAKKLLDAVFFDPSPAPIDRELAMRLYENRIYGTATRLESFNACPFSHFMRFGLRAKPTKVFRAAVVDEGSFCHEIIDAFIKYVIKNDVDYKSLSDSECDSIIDELAESVKENFNYGMFVKNIRYSVKAKYLTDMARDTIKAIVYHMKSGKFEFSGSEVVFGMGEDAVFPPLKIRLANGKDLLLSGKIDRIDSYNDDGTENIRIIDYKTGGKKFDFNELYAGLKIQLPIYLEAATQINSIRNACGMYYMPLIKAHTDEQDEQKNKEKMLKQFKLKGLMLSDLKIIQATNGEDSLSNRSEVVEYNKVHSDIYTAMPREKLLAVKKFAVRKAAETAERILEGRIDVSPYQASGKKPCKYCDYGSVCMFDETLHECKYRKLKNPDFNEIFGL